MASGTIKSSEFVIMKKRTLSISRSNAGYIIVGLGDGHGVQDITPAGYNYMSSKATNGSDATIRNSVAFLGLTANYSQAAFYTTASVNGTIDVVHYFIKNANLVEEAG